MINQPHRKMIAPELTLRAGAFDGFRELTLELGVDPNDIIKEVGLGETDLEVPDNQIPVELYRKALNLAAEYSKEKGFGLLLSQRQGFEKFGVLGYLARHAPNLEAMVLNIDRYVRVHDMSSISSFEINNKAALWTVELVAMSDVPTVQHAEQAMGLVTKLVRTATQASWTPSAVYFSHKRPSNYRLHERIFRCPVYFEQSAVGLEFLVSDLSAPLTTSDPGLYAVLQKYLDHIKPEKTHDFIAVVGDTIRSTLEDGKPSLDETAARLRMTSSQLQNQLRLKGTSYQSISQDVRHSLACQYLSSSDLPLSTISSLIGYAEPAVFTRAFKRKSGTTPRQWRNEALE